MNGRYRILEAVGRSGVLVEDQDGRAYQVSRNGQVVAYRVRAYGGEPRVWRDYRLDVGGRLLGDVLDALPAGAAGVYLTGVLEVSGDIQPSPAPVGSFARVRTRGLGGGMLEVHAARPSDLAPYRATFIRSGSCVVRAEFRPGAEVATLPLAGTSTAQRVKTVNLGALPSMAGLLVAEGSRVLEGEPIARFVRPGETASIEAAITAKRAALSQARARANSLRIQQAGQRDALSADLQAARRDVQTQQFLVSRDAAPRVDLEAAQARARAAEEKLAALALTSSAALSQVQDQADTLAVDLQSLTSRLQIAQAAQIVKSPVTGRVVEVRQGDATPQGVAVSLVLVEDPAPKEGTPNL